MDEKDSQLRQVGVTRYITPLREGGSLPAIVEADDGFMYVLKFRGAGQGVRSLIAELICGEMARMLGLKIPEIVFASLDTAFGRSEPDEEIQDLLKASVGLNLALHYLSGAISFDPVVSKVDSMTASKIVALDSLITNVDRTARNTNMLIWKKELWLIDHGAALYFHHSWSNWEEHARRPFSQIKEHVLLPYADDLAKAAAEIRTLYTKEKIASVTAMVPDDWLIASGQTETAEEARKVYTDFLNIRMESADIFINEAQHARESLI